MSTTGPQVFAALDRLQEEGKIRHYGVSVEKVEEALKAIDYPNVKTVQIIFNIFRQRPADLFFREAKAKQMGILARVPLASGLLTGKITRDTVFSGGRPPQFQPLRRVVRRGRNLLRRATLMPHWLPSKASARCVPPGMTYGPVCAALVPDVRRRHLRDPRRQAAGPG